MNELIFSAPDSLSLLDRAYSCAPSCRDTFCLLKLVAPPPHDLLRFKDFSTGAVQAAAAAIALLKFPNQVAIDLLEELRQLKGALDFVYSESHECDLKTVSDRTLTAFPAWRAVASCEASTSINHDGFNTVIGVHLMLRLIDKKQMSDSFCNAVRKDKSLRVLSGLEASALAFTETDSSPLWANRHKRELAAFIHTFENNPDSESFKLGFNDKARAQLKASAEHPKRGQREGVRTRHALSQHQFEEVFCPTLRAPFSTLNDQMLVIWLTCFAGLSFELLKDLPLGEPGPGSVICLDIEQGCLWKGFSALAPDQPTKGCGSPAGMSLRVPMPQDLHQHAIALHHKAPNAKNIGDLIEILTCIKNTDPIYPSICDFAPSWAKLKNTIGLRLRELELDSHLTALLTSDFGHTAKSKLHYSRVPEEEIQRACELSYLSLGFGAPVALHDRHLPLGSVLVPTHEQLKLAASIAVSKVDRARPGRNVSDLQRLTEFHNCYSLAVAQRITAGLALRNTKAIPLPGADLIAVTEKSVNERDGGLFAAVSPYLRNQVRLYRIHCKAMSTRCSKLQHSAFGKWLQAEPVNELALCSPGLQPKQISSTQVVKFVEDAVPLAVDFGRKHLENKLRHLGVKTTDIDRALRHEVSGQELLCSEASEPIFSWAKRMLPVIDEVLLDCFGSPLVGLRGDNK